MWEVHLLNRVGGKGKKVKNDEKENCLIHVVMMIINDFTIFLLIRFIHANFMFEDFSLLYKIILFLTQK